MLLCWLDWRCSYLLKCRCSGGISWFSATSRQAAAEVSSKRFNKTSASQWLTKFQPYRDNRLKTAVCSYMCFLCWLLCDFTFSTKMKQYVLVLCIVQVFSGSSVRCFVEKYYVAYQCKGSKPKVILLYVRYSTTSTHVYTQSRVCSMVALQKNKSSEQKILSLTIWESISPISSYVVLSCSFWLTPLRLHVFWVSVFK